MQILENLEIVLVIEYKEKEKEKMYFFNNERFIEEKKLFNLVNHDDEELIKKARETIKEYEDINEIKQAHDSVLEKSYGFIFSNRKLLILK